MGPELQRLGTVGDQIGFNRLSMEISIMRVFAGVAEADGNRTRQRLNQPLTGFEDRGTHQASGRLQVALRE